MAVGGLVFSSLVVGTCFGVEEDGGDYGLHIAASSGSVVVEGGGNVGDVGGAGIAFDEVLDEHLADEWA